MRYPTVLFDLDHTLLDSDASLMLAFVETMGGVGLADPASHYATFDRINRALWTDVEAGTRTPPEVSVERFRQLGHALDLAVDASALAAAYADALGRHGDLYPGARSLLEGLHGRVTMALVTNGLSDVQRSRIDRLDLGRYFSAITISAEVGAAKPAREIFELTFATLGDPDPTTAIMVGDNPPSDIKGGLDFGIATCWYNPAGRAGDPAIPATHEVADLASIAAVVTGG